MIKERPGGLLNHPRPKKITARLTGGSVDVSAGKKKCPKRYGDAFFFLAANLSEAQQSVTSGWTQSTGQTGTDVHVSP